MENHKLTPQQLLLQNAKYSLINSFGMFSINTIAVIILARSLGVTNYGVIVFINYLLAFSYTLFSNDLSSVHLISKNSNHSQILPVILRGIIFYTFLFGFLLSLILWIVSFFSSYLVPQNLSQYYLVISILLVMNLFLGFYSSFFDGLQSMKWTLLVALIPNLLRTIGFIYLTW